VSGRLARVSSGRCRGFMEQSRAAVGRLRRHGQPPM
jgi:hypothetical protein